MNYTIIGILTLIFIIIMILSSATAFIIGLKVYSAFRKSSREFETIHKKREEKRKAILKERERLLDERKELLAKQQEIEKEYKNILEQPKAKHKKALSKNEESDD